MRFLRRVLASLAFSTRPQVGSSTEFWLAGGLILTTTFCISSTARAGGGIASAWVQSHTDHSVNIKWSDPDPGEYAYCDDWQLVVCYKKHGDSKSPCKNKSDRFTVNPQRLVTVFNLSPSTTYDFELFVEAAKKGGRFDYKHCKSRKLGSFTLTTDATYSPTYIDWIVLSAAAKKYIRTTVYTSHPSDFDMVRVGYKLLWSSSELKSVTSVRDAPANIWGESDSHRGWLDIPPTSTMEFVFRELEDCRLFKLVAYGFRPGSPAGEFLGETGGKTGEYCSPFDFMTAFIDDEENELQSYADALHQFYCGASPRLAPCDSLSIFNHVAAQHPELLEDYQAMLQDGDLLTSEYETIQYLEHAQRDIFDAWQSEPDLVAAGMDMLQFAEREFPAVYASIVAETTGKPIVEKEEPVPTIWTYPNPFNPETTIAFAVKNRGAVSLSIYDVAGRLVRSLVDETLAEGSYARVWNGRDNEGQQMASGIYFYKFVTDDFSETKKIVLLK